MRNTQYSEIPMKWSPWLIRRLQIALEAANALSTIVSEKTERKAAEFKPTEDLQLDKGRIIREYVNVLDNGNEETWLEGLPSMGPGPDIPHLFRCPGGKVCSLGGYCSLPGKSLTIGMWSTVQKL